MRKKAMSEMRELLDMGYSRKQVAEAIIPASGKKTNRAAVKDRLKMILLLRYIRPQSLSGWRLLKQKLQLRGAMRRLR